VRGIRVVVAVSKGNIDANNDFSSIRNYGRRFLCIGDLRVASMNYLLKVNMGLNEVW
jgi:hypothetical protein